MPAELKRDVATNSSKIATIIIIIFAESSGSTQFELLPFQHLLAELNQIWRHSRPGLKKEEQGEAEDGCGGANGAGWGDGRKIR